MAFQQAVLAITDPGDEVILPAPFYFNQEMAVQIAGCRAVPVATGAHYRLDLEAVESYTVSILDPMPDAESATDGDDLAL